MARGFFTQTRFPKLWLWAQHLVGGTKDKQKLALRYYSGERRILEIGCSVGNISEAFIGMPNVEFTGIDVDHIALELARKRFSGHNNFRFLDSPLCDLADAGELFDYVLFAGMLHHVDDVEAASLISDALKITAPGGRLVLSEPEALRPEDSLIFSLFYRLEQGRYLRSRCALRTLVDRSGATVEICEDHFVTPGIVPWPEVARFTVIVAHKDT